MQNTSYACTLVKVAFSGHILEKYSKTKFRKYPSNGRRVVASGQTDGHEVANSRFNDLANAPKRYDIHDIKTVFLELYLNSVTVNVLTPAV
jgi:hypothetical protein